MISDEALEIIKHWEGFRSEPYLCSGGYWTIGYGHVLREDGRMLTYKDAKPSVSMSQSEATVLLSEVEGNTYWTAANRLCNPAGLLNDNQLAALTSFCYNLGVGALRQSTLRRKVLAGEHHAVPREFRKWVNAGGKRIKGLVLRREAEAALYGA